MGGRERARAQFPFFRCPGCSPPPHQENQQLWEEADAIKSKLPSAETPLTAGVLLQG